MSRLNASEWVSIGHPDKTCDFITSYILDKHIEVDPSTRYAVEVMLKGSKCILGGEITSKAEFTEEDITKFVREAVGKIGYTKEYQKAWGEENVICGDDIDVEMFISKQSSEISQGVSNGWGDQGIFWGMAVRGESMLPLDYNTAKKIGQALYNERIGGIDIKTLVTTLDDEVTNVIVAVPLKTNSKKKDVENLVRRYAPHAEIIINGTGSYVMHSSVADCGVTGRKLAVDFYGGNCKIGGGSPWTKDGTKADLTLNIYARLLAVDYLKNRADLDAVYCSISCSIGSPDILVTFKDECGNDIGSRVEKTPPKELIKRFSLDKPVFSRLCMEGLFTGWR